MFQPLAPSGAQLASWYAYMGRNPANLLVSPLLRRRLTRRLLDVGCGGGGLLRVAASLGWTAHGTEISATCCALLRPMLGERLHEGTLASAPFEAGTFDVAIMTEVIEHLVDPLEYARAAHRLLAPGGALLLTTPNIRGASARLLGTAWEAVGDEHLAYFDRTSMRVLLRRAGFSDVRITLTSLDIRAVVARLRGTLRPKPEGASRPIPTAEVETAPPRDGLAARVRAGLVDHSMEMVNRVVGGLRLGDNMRVLAIKS